MAVTGWAAATCVENALDDRNVGGIEMFLKNRAGWINEMSSR